MSTWALNAFLQAGQNGVWLAGQLIHAIEITPKSSPWGLPQFMAKSAVVTALFFAHVAHLNRMVEWKLTCIALATVSFAASYAFRKLSLADLALDELKRTSSEESETAKQSIGNALAVNEAAKKALAEKTETIDALQEDIRSLKAKVVHLEQSIYEGRKEERTVSSTSANSGQDPIPSSPARKIATAFYNLMSPQ